MNEKNRARLGVERLEDRDAPAAVNVTFPGGYSRTVTFRQSPWVITSGRAPYVSWNVVGRHGSVATPWGVWRW